MTSLISQAPTVLSQAPRIVRPAATTVLAQTDTEREQRKHLNRIRLDSAIELNRANTPKDVSDQRVAPRYSIRETNELSSDQIRSRLAQINRRDTRPGIMKVLDIIDMPRNVVQNMIADIFLPEAKRAAIERGEFDQSGSVKIFGGDILRAMGFENRFVNAIAGFGIDIVTDPLSFIGAPLGGAKIAATKGASFVITKTGKKQLRKGISRVAKGESLDGLAPEVARRIQASIATSPKVLNPREQAEFASKEIFGESGRLSKIADKFGLGISTKGSGIADDLIEVTDETGRRVLSKTNEIVDSPLVANRINASKDFVDKFTTLPGIDLTKGAGGATLAHIPFTQLSLTTPQIRVGAINLGHAQVVQRALAKARTGNLNGGAVIVAAKNATDGATRIAQRMEQLTNSAIAKSEEALAEANPVSRETFEIERLLIDDEITKLVAEIDEIKAQRVGGIAIDDEADTIVEFQGRILDSFDAAKNGSGSLEGGESLGDMIASAAYTRNAVANLRLAEAHRKFSDLSTAANRISSEDVVNINSKRESLRLQLARKLDLAPDDAFDEVIDAARQDDAMLKIIAVHQQRAGEKYGRFLDLAESDLDNAEATADAFGEVVSGAAEVAFHSGKATREFMGSEARLMSDVAKKILRLDAGEMGDMPFTKIGDMLRTIGVVDGDQILSEIGFRTAVNFGGVGGVVAARMAAHRRAVTGAEDVGGAMAEQWRRGQGRFKDIGLDSIATKRNIPSENYDTLRELISLQVEALGKTRAGQKQLVYNIGDGSFLGGIMKRAKEGKMLRQQNPELWEDIDQSANAILDLFEEIGVNKVRRGDLTTAGTGYVGVALKKEGADKVRAVHRASSIKNTDTEQLIGSLVNVTDARGSNMIEFTDANGIDHAFSLNDMDIARATAADADTFAKIQIENPSLAAKIDAINESVLESHDNFGIPLGTGDDTDDLFRNVSRPVTPGELNQMASNGDLNLLQSFVGGDLVDTMRIYETDPAVLIQQAVRSDRIAEAKAGFNDAISPFVVAKVPDPENALKIGDKARLADGSTMELISPNRFKAGDGRIYRKIDPNAIDSTSLFLPAQMMDDAKYESLLPEALATQLERMNQTLNPEGLKGVMKLASKITSLFRTSTLLHPSWMVANGMGNALLAVMDDPELLTNPARAVQYMRHFKNALRIEMHKNFNGAGPVGGKVFKTTQKIGLGPDDLIPITGRDQRVGDLLVQANLTGLDNAAQAGDAQQALHQTTNLRAPLDTSAGASKGFLGPFKDRTARNKANLENRRGTVAAGPLVEGIETTRAIAGAAKTNILNKAMRAWFAANGSVDNTFRLTQYLMKLDDGMDAVSAAQASQRAMLNFGDMSQFETNVIRPLIPFYSWMRASLPNFLMRSLRDPKQIASTPKLINAMEELFAGEDRLPRHERPRWLQSQLAVQVGTNPESISSLGVGTLLPQEGALQVASGVAGLVGISDFNGRDFMDSINWLFGQTSPVVKAPAELGFGREAFTNRTIGSKSEGADLSLKEYAFGQVRLLKEFGVGQERIGPVQRAAAQGSGALAARGLIGGRFSQGLSEDNRLTSFFFELKEREGNLRKTIRKAEKRGDDKSVVRFKEELLATYADYLNKGGDPKDVPKWAREDLAGFGFGA